MARSSGHSGPSTPTKRTTAGLSSARRPRMVLVSDVEPSCSTSIPLIVKTQKKHLSAFKYILDRVKASF